METNAAGRLLVRSFEGLHDGDRATAVLEPMLCPAGLWTVGYGHVLNGPDGPFKGPALREAAFAEWRRRWPAGMTDADADNQLSIDLRKAERVVMTQAPPGLTSNQFSALVAFVYNVGGGAFAGSTLLKKLKAGDKAGAADQFLAWDKATDPRTGQKVALPGLSRRRRAERNLFLTEG